MAKIPTKKVNKPVMKKPKVEKVDVVPVDPQKAMDEKTLADKLKDYENEDWSKFIKEVESEYQYSYWYMMPKWSEWALRLRLYNNQRRDKTAVGDPLLFTTFNTVLASLYTDKMEVVFTPREEGDDEIAENLNNTAEFDYEEMEKDLVDYEWDWDAAFFGRGLCSMVEWDHEQNCPVPEVWDPMTVLRDPDATSVNGDKKGRGKAKWLYREIRLSKEQMRDQGVYFNIDKVNDDGKNINSLVDRNKDLRDSAQGRANTNKWQVEGYNKTYRLIEGFRYFDGKLVFFTLANDKTLMVRYTELPRKYIPVIDRCIYPMSHDWDGASIPDLVEDKQRGRAILINVGLKSAKASVEPMYLFDTNKVKNRADLNFEFNKFIAVDGNTDGAVVPMMKDRMGSDVQYILNLLDANAQRATATPDIQQGQLSGQKRTATEIDEVSNNIGTRYSLSAKIWGWSEKRFWQYWYYSYKEYFTEKIAEKTVRISGALGARFRKMSRENLVAENADPDVAVQSKAIADAERFNNFKIFQGVFAVIQNDPNANVRYAEKHLCKLAGMKQDQIDLLLPPTIDELTAQEENLKLEADKPIFVHPNDDHRIHIEIHNKLADTPAKIAHMNAHRMALMLQKTNPEILPPAASAMNPVKGAGQQPSEMDNIGAPEKVKQPVNNI
jgi:hypothetical protein